MEVWRFVKTKPFFRAADSKRRRPMCILRYEPNFGLAKQAEKTNPTGRETIFGDECQRVSRPTLHFTLRTQFLQGSDLRRRRPMCDFAIRSQFATFPFGCFRLAASSGRLNACPTLLRAVFTLRTQFWGELVRKGSGALGWKRRHLEKTNPTADSNRQPKPAMGEVENTNPMGGPSLACWQECPPYAPGRTKMGGPRDGTGVPGGREILSFQTTGGRRFEHLAAKKNRPRSKAFSKKEPRAAGLKIA